MSVSARSAGKLIVLVKTAEPETAIAQFLERVPEALTAILGGDPNDADVRSLNKRLDLGDFHPFPASSLCSVPGASGPVGHILKSQPENARNPPECRP